MLDTKKERNQLRKHLNAIDEILQDTEIDVSDLWLILTALRGPDSADDWIKGTYTVPIRVAAFPKTAHHNYTGADFSSEYSRGLDFKQDLARSIIRSPSSSTDEKYHYQAHIRAAAERLCKLRDTAEADSKEDTDGQDPRTDD